MSRFNWLQGYAEYTAESESPDSFHLWTGLSVLASAVRRNIWVNQGLYMLFPNMYVILVGPPGKVAKSTTIRLGRTLLLGVEDIIFGPDSLTREELIRVIAKSGGEGKQSAVTLHSTELSSLIEPSGITMIQFLTDIYDGDYKWRYSTKGKGRDVIHNPILNILAGTTPSWVAEGMPADVVGHGFTARVIFIYEDQPRFLNPYPKEPDPRLIKTLMEDLIQISKLQGPMIFTDDARELYAEYYMKLGATEPTDYRIEGFHWRKKIHLLKVATLLSVAERDDLRITPTEIETAWDLLASIEDNMYKTFSAVGKYEHATDLERILEQIKRSKNGMHVQEIYRRNRSVGNVDELGKILQMLMSMGAVLKEKREDGSYFIPSPSFS